MDKNIDIQKLAKLAKLKLRKEDEAYVTSKIENLCSYFEILEEVSTIPTTYKKDESLQENYREDIAKRTTFELDSFSPYTENNFFKVSSVIDSE